MGGALSVPTIAGFLNGCTPKPELTWQPVFFDKEQARLIMQMSERILPETDTPGAKSLGIPGFVEEMVSICYRKEDKEIFMEGMAAFNRSCEKEMGKGFIALDAEKQHEFLMQHNKVIQGSRFEDQDVHSKFFWRVKELTLIGYCTSEYGATQVLQYSAIPVEYKGCVPVREAGNGKAWAT